MGKFIKILILGFGFSLIAGVQGIADETSHVPSWAFECHFVSPHGGSSCKVSAELCSYDAALNADNRCSGIMEAQCNGRKIFRGLIQQSSDSTFQYFHNGRAREPIVRYPTDHPSRERFAVTAWLRWQGEMFQGSCDVRERIRVRP